MIKSAILKERGIRKDRMGNDGTREYCYIGIKLKSDLREEKNLISHLQSTSMGFLKCPSGSLGLTCPSDTFTSISASIGGG
jgi:hypothetical protein